MANKSKLPAHVPTPYKCITCVTYRKVSTTNEHSKSTNVHWELPSSIYQGSWRKTNPQSLFVPHLDTLFMATTALARPFHWPSPCAHMALLLLSVTTQIMFVPINTCPMRLSFRFAMFVKLTSQCDSQFEINQLLDVGSHTTYGHFDNCEHGMHSTLSRVFSTLLGMTRVDTHGWLKMLIMATLLAL